MRVLSLFLSALVFLFVLAAPADARADGDADPAEEPSSFDRELAKLPWKLGPQSLELGRGVSLALPAGYRFLGQPNAGELMKKMGNLHNENLLGIVLSADPADGYLVSLRYDEEGSSRTTRSSTPRPSSSRSARARPSTTRSARSSASPRSTRTDGTRSRATTRPSTT